MPHAALNRREIAWIAARKQRERREGVMHWIAERSIGALLLYEVLEKLLDDAL